MHWNILDSKRIELLKNIVNTINIGEYYMAGGTALSLQLGLRKSVDFDFFVPHTFNSHSLYKQLEKISDNDIKILNIDEKGTCDVSIANVQVSFFEYIYKSIDNYVKDKELPKLTMASIRDIAVMKALAIGSRAAKKDFFDLYQIVNLNNYGVQNLVEDLYEKCGDNHDFSYIGMGLVYFEEAEGEKLPETFVNYDWNEIKKFFISMQQPFFNEIERHQMELENNEKDISDNEIER